MDFNKYIVYVYMYTIIKIYFHPHVITNNQTVTHENYDILSVSWKIFETMCIKMSQILDCDY